MNKNTEKFILLSSVFICGAVIMILEIVGARIFAPFFGTSIYIWTALIGVILGSMSFGYFLGGKLADNGATFEKYSFIITLGSLTIAIMGFVKFPIMSTISLFPLSLPARGLLGAFVLFAVPAAILAMSSPFAVKLLLQTIDNAGKVSGKISAFSTMGSIVGTFLAGFVLIPLFGNTNIITGLAVILAIQAIIVYPKKSIIFNRTTMLTIILCLVVLTQIFTPQMRNMLVMLATRYNTVWVFDTTHNGQPTRIMQIGLGWQSGRYLYSDELVFEWAC